MRWSVWPGLLGVGLLLSGCGLGGGAARLEEAARQVASDGPGRLVGEPQIRLVRPIAGGAAVLLSYELDEHGQRQRWTTLALFRHRLGRWSPLSISGGGQPVDAPLQPVEVASGVHADADADQRLRYAYGLVHDPAVRQIAVTFEDGTRLVVPVEDGAYLAIVAQPGAPTQRNMVQFGLIGVRLEALDAQGAILHRIQP